MTYVQQLQQALRNTVTCWEFCGAVYPFPYIGHTHTHRHTHTETHTLIHQSVFYTPLSLLLNNDFYNLPLEIHQQTGIQECLCVCEVGEHTGLQECVCVCVRVGHTQAV